jgi:hypothetical protein
VQAFMPMRAAELPQKPPQPEVLDCGSLQGMSPEEVHQRYLAAVAGAASTPPPRKNGRKA